MKQPTAKAIVYNLAFLFLMTLWYAVSKRTSTRWDLWIWSVCLGTFVLSVSRFFIRHSIPFPEIGLLSFPFLFGFFFFHICPPTRVASYDQFLWSFDGNFGYPQVWLGRLFEAVPLCYWICKIVWSSLPFFFVVLYLFLPAEIRNKFITALVATACIILPLYAICPGAGPAYLFGHQYPNPALPIAKPVPVFLSYGTLLNTTPSGHVTWALLLLWFAIRYTHRAVAWGFGFVLVATTTATLGLGEHYVIDLILAVPYAAAILWLINRQWLKSAILLALLVVWNVVLRHGWALNISSYLAWSLAAASMSLVVLPQFSLKPLNERDEITERDVVASTL